MDALMVLLNIVIVLFLSVLAYVLGRLKTRLSLLNNLGRWLDSGRWDSGPDTHIDLLIEWCKDEHESDFKLARRRA